MSDCLVLNSNGVPVTLLPLSVISWQESIKFMTLNKVEVLKWHTDWVVRSPNWSTPVPSVVMLKEYLKPKEVVRFSRTNLYIRDGGECQYCGLPLDHREATVDHVIPASNGGKTTWANCTIACMKCNVSKGNKHYIFPMSIPHKPSYYELIKKRKQLKFTVKHKEWLQFIE